MADWLGPKMNKKKQKWTPCDFGNDTLTPWDSWPCLLFWRYYVYMRPVKSSLKEECMPPCHRLFYRVGFIFSDCSSLA